MIQPVYYDIFLECDLFADIVYELINRDALLCHGIAVTYSYAAICLAVEVVSDAHGGANFVLTAIALADGTGVIKVHHELFGQLSIDLAGLFAELFGKRQNGAHVPVHRQSERSDVPESEDVVRRHQRYVPVC